MIQQAWNIALLVVGFGFVIFWHELGHFLAAKWVGIKVEQFAVGFGQALLCWRKGIGLRIGTTAPEMEKRIAAGAAPASFGETEYRLNWIPLGGYVKMLGQDDMKPNAESDDPNAYNRKSVGARMLVVSAGVIMNVILAAIVFVIVFASGLKSPAAIAGAIIPNSPAAQAYKMVDGKQVAAPLQTGDRILFIDGRYQHEFSNIALSTALSHEGSTLPVMVRRRDGTNETIYITPRRPANEKTGFLAMGVGQPTELRGAEMADEDGSGKIDPKTISSEYLAVGAGDVITAVDSVNVQPEDQFVLEDALQNSDGKPIVLTIKNAKTGERKETINPIFQGGFDETGCAILGMKMRTQVIGVREKSPALGQLLPGDVVLGVRFEDGLDQPVLQPAMQAFFDVVNKAGTANRKLIIKVLRAGVEVETPAIIPSMKVAEDRYGLGISPGWDQDHAVIADLQSDSPAVAAKIPVGATITAINGQNVKSWFDVRKVLRSASAGEDVSVTASVDGKETSYSMPIRAEHITALNNMRFTSAISTSLAGRMILRKARGPVEAVQWGVAETRNFIQQFYVTLRRMTEGSVSPKNMMGPIGIMHAGVQFAAAGIVRLLWFLAMISANLAVVNFLPVPVVDGGLFLFLIIEKIWGKPLSPKLQVAAQVVGLVLILGVFLLVTYQDIMRLTLFR